MPKFVSMSVYMYVCVHVSVTSTVCTCTYIHVYIRRCVHVHNHCSIIIINTCIYYIHILFVCFCCVNMHRDSPPSQTKPSPVNPSRHTHVNLPDRPTHTAYSEQSLLSRQSSIAAECAHTYMYNVCNSTRMCMHTHNTVLIHVYTSACTHTYM